MKVDERKFWIEQRIGRSLTPDELMVLRRIERKNTGDIYWIFGLIERSFNHGKSQATNI